MRKLVVLGIVVSAPAFLLILGYAVKSIGQDFGDLAMLGAVLAIFFTMISFAGLVDLKGAATKRMLEDIERAYRVDLRRWKKPT